MKIGFENSKSPISEEHFNHFCMAFTRLLRFTEFIIIYTGVNYAASATDNFIFVAIDKLLGASALFYLLYHVGQLRLLVRGDNKRVIGGWFTRMVLLVVVSVASIELLDYLRESVRAVAPELYGGGAG